MAHVVEDRRTDKRPARLTARIATVDGQLGAVVHAAIDPIPDAIPGGTRHHWTDIGRLRQAVADSQRASASANAYSWRDMEANLRANGIDFDAIPKVVQFNKRDLPDVKPLQEIRKSWGDIPTHPAVAMRGEGGWGRGDPAPAGGRGRRVRSEGGYAPRKFPITPFTKSSSLTPNFAPKP